MVVSTLPVDAKAAKFRRSFRLSPHSEKNDRESCVKFESSYPKTTCVHIIAEKFAWASKTETGYLPQNALPNSKGGLISVSFLIWFKCSKKDPKLLFWVSSLYLDNVQCCDLALCLEGMSQGDFSEVQWMEMRKKKTFWF